MNPFSLEHLATIFNSLWLRWTYPFAKFGSKVGVHYSCDILRSIAPNITLGDKVYLAPDVWLNVAPGSESREPKIVLGNGCGIGRRSMISARNRIELQEDVLLAPSVLIMDHNHEFSDINRPIIAQGVTSGGTIVIERNCWLGFGAAIVCNRGELVIGRNSVVGANAVVTRSIPPFSIVGGNPARIIKKFDLKAGAWVKP